MPRLLLLIVLDKERLKSAFCPDSTNSSENIYTMMNPIGPGGNRPNVSVARLHFPVSFWGTGLPERGNQQFCPFKVLVLSPSSSLWDLGLTGPWGPWEPWSRTT